MMEKAEARTILIAGPTAGGKSAVAAALASEISGEIINADALQVYRDLRILSARPSKTDEARAPHHLFGHVDAARRYSVGEWSRDVATIVAEIHARGSAAIFVGGTGLYFRALEKGIAEAPEIDAESRDHAAARLEEIGLDAFRREVLEFDPAMARLDPNDRQRHLRAFEVYHATGAPLSEWRGGETPLVDRIDARILIEPPRETLYRSIEARFDAMLAEGALEEARALFDRGLDRDLPAMKAVGAAELIAHLRGETSLDVAVSLAKRNSRRLAKRQLTWFRNQTPNWPRESNPAMALGGLRAALAEKT